MTWCPGTQSECAAGCSLGCAIPMDRWPLGGNLSQTHPQPDPSNWARLGEPSPEPVKEPEPPPNPLPGPLFKHAVYLVNGMKMEILSLLDFNTFVMMSRANGYIASPGLFLNYRHIVGIFDQTAQPKDDAPSNVTPLRRE